jgi:hypothetical protein
MICGFTAIKQTAGLLGKLLFMLTPVETSQALGCGSDIQILAAGIPEANHPESIAEPILPQPIRIRPLALMSSKFIISSLLLLLA